MMERDSKKTTRISQASLLVGIFFIKGLEETKIVQINQSSCWAAGYKNLVMKGPKRRWGVALAKMNFLFLLLKNYKKWKKLIYFAPRMLRILFSFLNTRSPFSMNN
jgi:hypothetical protein